jgi:hypothetical protein
LQEYEKYIDALKRSIGDGNKRKHFLGVVESIMDPLTLGRVKVRCFNIHPEDRNLVPTEDLPWAIVLAPTTSASISGIGWSPNGLENGSWVHGFFFDGDECQYPVVDGVFPVIHRPNPPDQPGGTAAGYIDPEASYSEGAAPNPEVAKPYHGQIIENHSSSDYDDVTTITMPNGTQEGTGALAAHGDINMVLTKANIPEWDTLGLPTYNWKTVPQGYACKDGKDSMRMHYGTALAFEKLTKDFGKGKLTVYSAYRTPEYNATLPGAAPNSQHIQGRALDVSRGSMGGRSGEQEFLTKAAQDGFVGFGYYDQFFHIDTGTGRYWGSTPQWFIDAIQKGGWYSGKKGLTDVSVNPGTNAAQPSGGTTPSSLDATNLNSRNDVYDYSKDYLKGQGFSDVQSAAILSNMQHESSFNPNELGDGNTSYGLFQWHADRLSGLKTYANAQGADYTNTNTQLQYFVKELNTSESGAGTALRNATTLSEANDAMAQYERYQGYKSAGGEKSQRLATAGQIYSDTFQGNAAPMKGFVDPTNSLPFASYRGEPSTHTSARGFNTQSSVYEVALAETDRVGGFPMAGDGGTFGEPETQAAPQYPYNKTYATKSGHLVEYDDTPGSERINIKHKSGAKVEMNPDGSITIKSKESTHNYSNGNMYQGAEGEINITAIKGMGIRSTADMKHEAAGSHTIRTGRNHEVAAQGDVTITAGGEIYIKGTGVYIEAQTIDVKATGDLFLESLAGIFMKGKTINVEAKETFNLRSKNIGVQAIEDMGIKTKNLTAQAEKVLGLKAKNLNLQADDIGMKTGGDINMDPGGAIHVDEGASPSVDDVADIKEIKTAFTTDLGTVPPSTVITKAKKKQPGARPITSADTSAHYAQLLKKSDLSKLRRQMNNPAFIETLVKPATVPDASSTVGTTPGGALPAGITETQRQQAVSSLKEALQRRIDQQEIGTIGLPGLPRRDNPVDALTDAGKATWNFITGNGWQAN